MNTISNKVQSINAGRKNSCLMPNAGEKMYTELTILNIFVSLLTKVAEPTICHCAFRAWAFHNLTTLLLSFYTQNHRVDYRASCHRKPFKQIWPSI